jgi:uncharacterized protein
MMTQRILRDKVKEALGKYPIVAITGPRQSGKTTFAKMLQPGYRYVNLEDISTRSFALKDPKGFIETYKEGVIIDEVQYAPDLFSYLQVYTDQRQVNGEYIITGSQNFLMMEKISQSLAGRVALFNLLPFSFEELKNGKFSIPTWEDYLLSGTYPRKWVQQIDAPDFYENYVRTYIERDIRLIKNISNLDLFQKFLQLLAGRTGQLFNQSSLGNELGVDNKTINSWMTLLEVSFIAFRLQPYYNNYNKRLVKTPKIYFYDTGLLSYLLGIRTVNDLNLHFAKGQMFENLVLLELIKNIWNRNTHDKFYFWRDRTGHEVDILLEQGQHLKAIEIKSGKTLQPDFFKSLSKFKEMKSDMKSYLIYGGSEYQKRTDCTVLGFYDLNKVMG